MFSDTKEEQERGIKTRRGEGEMRKEGRKTVRENKSKGGGVTIKTKVGEQQEGDSVGR